MSKNCQLLTGGIFYCRDSEYFNVSAFNKLSCNLTGKCFEIGNKNIPPTVTIYAKTKESKYIGMKTNPQIAHLLTHQPTHDRSLHKSCFLADAPDKMTKFELLKIERK